MSFQTFNLDASILKAIQEAGYDQPTPIQTKSIPEIMLNKHILASAQTGTGKTAAFVLPILDKLTKNKCHTDQSQTTGCKYPPNLSFYDYVQNILADYSSRYEMEAHTILHLLMLYGTNTPELLDLCLKNPLLKNKISTEHEDIEAQIVYAIRNESAYTLEDILTRRLTIGLSRDKIEKSVIQTISHYLSQEFELMARERDKVTKELLTKGY